MKIHHQALTQRDRSRRSMTTRGRACSNISRQIINVLIILACDLSVYAYMHYACMFGRVSLFADLRFGMRLQPYRSKQAKSCFRFQLNILYKIYVLDISTWLQYNAARVIKQSCKLTTDNQDMDEVGLHLQRPLIGDTWHIDDTLLESGNSLTVQLPSGKQKIPSGKCKFNFSDGTPSGNNRQG